MINREQFALLFSYHLERRRLTLSEFTARMNALGLKTSYQQAYRWKKGTTLPNALQLVAICQVLHITNMNQMFSDLTVKKILDDQKKAANIIQMPQPEPMADEDYKISHRQLPIILQKASAGTGQYVDDADIEMVYVRENVPENANFGIHVSGDSMEPQFHNGELVWVEKKDTLQSGDIGVFYLDGNIYIKRLEYGTDHPCLRSLNRHYKPIPIKETSVFTVWGKVVAH